MTVYIEIKVLLENIYIESCCIGIHYYNSETDHPYITTRSNLAHIFPPQVTFCVEEVEQIASS